MGIAYEITKNDVSNVLRQNEYAHVSEDTAEAVFEELDADEVKCASLNGCDDLDSQTVAAYKVIRDQLIRLRLLPFTAPFTAPIHS